MGEVRRKRLLRTRVDRWTDPPSKRRPYASAIAANDTTPKTNTTSTVAPKSHIRAKTTGTGSSKNLPYAWSMAPANARPWGFLAFLRDGRLGSSRWWCRCYGPWTSAVLEEWSSTWPRSPPSFSWLALARKIRYLRASILNLIELSASGPPQPSFLNLRACELRRITLPRTPLNMGEEGAPLSLDASGALAIS